jgi:LysM repeat protein
MRTIPRLATGCLLLALVLTACSLGSEAPTPQGTLPALVPSGAFPTAVAATPTTLVVPTLANQAPAASNVLPTADNSAVAGGSSGSTTGNTDITAVSDSAGGGANTGSNTTGTCTPPAGWVTYTVQAGDTVSSLAAAYGIVTAELAAANCLANADVINVGQTVYVPANRLAATSAPVSNANPSATSVPAAAGGSAGSTTSSSGTSIQNVWVEPATVQNDGQYYVTNGSAVTFRVRGITNAVKVTFVLQPIGNTATPTTLGADTNLADGVSVPWIVNDPNLNANVWAIATDSAGASTQSQPIVVVARH